MLIITNEDKVRKSLNTNYDEISTFFEIYGKKCDGLNATQLAYKYKELTNNHKSVEYLRKLISLYLKDLKTEIKPFNYQGSISVNQVKALKESWTHKPDHTEQKDFKSQNLTFDIKEWLEQGKKQQQLANKANGYLEKELDINLQTNRNQVAVMLLADVHFGSYGANYEELERLTDIILNTDGLFVILGGDICEMAIKMRGMKEVSGNMFTPEQQMDFLDKWLEEIQHKVLFAIWGNHESERLENAGSSEYSRIIRKYTNYIDGIAHVNIKVGNSLHNETYKIAASHRFRGGVTNQNPTASTIRYLEGVGKGFEIGLQGDTHMSGVSSWTNSAGEKRLALNAGTLHTDSHFSKRYFSILTDQKMPVFTLNTHKHSFNGFASVDDWKDSLQF